MLALAYGQAVVVHGARCVGHGLCASVCPTAAIALTLGDLSGRRDLPAIEPTLELRAVLVQALTNDFVSASFELGRRVCGRWCGISHMECRRAVGLEFITDDESSAFHITFSQPSR